MRSFDVAGELERRVPAKLAVLRMLELAGARGCTNLELIRGGGGTRAPGRVDDLRREGYDITAEREHGGIWRYTLKAHPPERQVPLLPRRARVRPVVLTQARLFS